jgi:hypothetical protein
MTMGEFAEQLPRNVPVPVVVLDHIEEKPTDN